MAGNKQIVLLVSLLLLLGGGAVAYKHWVLGFPLLAGAVQDVWLVEAKVSFESKPEQAVEVGLTLAASEQQRKIVFSRQLGDGYQFEVAPAADQEGAAAIAYWRAEGRTGPQTLYYVLETFFAQGQDQLLMAPAPTAQPTVNLSALQRQLAEQLLATLTVAPAQLTDYSIAVLSLINQLDQQSRQTLLSGSNKRAAKTNLAINLLAMGGLPARLARGIPLDKEQRSQPLMHYLEVYEDSGWRLFDPRDEQPLSWRNVLILSRGDTPVLDVFGGSGSTLRFALIKELRPQFDTAISAGLIKDSAFVNFSIYSLPVAEQAAFKLLLLIPLGALVVVVIRNLVGIRTSGTFMPILIAITFIQTTLLTGLVLFLLVVGVGLFMRAYLTHLNLLLVPRIASVLVFVIVIYGVVGVVGHKLNLPWSASVTFFPMIILSWTIERMSILWEEEGWHEVFIQGGGSLLVAVLAYFLMANDSVADTLFMYPEILLVVLAIIIAIGSYSGYRLSDLRRFEPMEKY